MINAGNTIALQPHADIIVNEETHFPDLVESQTFLPHRVTFDQHGSHVGEIETLTTTKSILHYPRLANDHHDFRRRMYPATFDYLFNEVMPDGTVINPMAHKWSVLNQQALQQQNQFDTLFYRLEDFREDMDSAEHNPTIVNDLVETLRDEMNARTEVLVRQQNYTGPTFLSNVKIAAIQRLIAIGFTMTPAVLASINSYLFRAQQQAAPGIGPETPAVPVGIFASVLAAFVSLFVSEQGMPRQPFGIPTL